MPAHRQRQDDGSLHLEFPRGRYALVVTERGEERSRRETGDIDELLYWLFASAAWSRGWNYELAHRHPTRIRAASALQQRWMRSGRFRRSGVNGWARNKHGSWHNTPSATAKAGTLKGTAGFPWVESAHA